MKTPLPLLTKGILLFQAMQAYALPTYDGFAYTAGNSLAGNGGWIAASGSGTIKVNATNLTQAGLQSSVGNDVAIIPGSSAARTYIGFTSQTSGSVCFSFLFRINSPPSAQRLVGYASGSTSSSSSPPLGIFVTAGGQLAVGISTGSPQFTSTQLATGATNLIVVSYTFGGTADSAQVWINPTSLGGNAPAPTASLSGTHNAALANFLWNTPSASSGGGSYEVDEFRIGATYADVTPATTPGSGTGGSSILRVTQMDLAGATFTLTGKGGQASGFFETLGTGDLMRPLPEWQLHGAGTFDAGGNFTTTVPVTPGVGSRFFVVGPAGVPAIATQPQSQPTAAGQNVTLTVQAGGSQSLSYQWYKNSQLIEGATNPTFSII
ncbi:MAG: immunoglobulin domain-containing protein, partial [Verrucomicrobiota bacterium]